MGKILVTGGTGLVGYHLKEVIPNAIYLGSKDCDLTNFSLTEKLIQTYKPSVVVHLAARVGGLLDNIKYPADYFDDNILINTNILKACRTNNIRRFIGVLSTCVYPEKVDNYPMSEDDLFTGPPPVSNFSYGYAKRCLAVQIEAYNKQFKTNYNYLIPCNLYGKYDDLEDKDKMHFLTALMVKIINTKNNTLNLLGTGKPLRQFMYAGDLARVIKEVIEKDITENFNVAPSYNYSIDQMAKMALEFLEKKYVITYEHPKLDGQFRKDVCNKKMLKLIPEFEFTDFNSGFKKVFKIIEKRLNKLK
tara:strand:+ start:327 stop:1238 length:912 start_codon:yes stop_codon:yes gene_type:complete